MVSFKIMTNAATTMAPMMTTGRDAGRDGLPGPVPGLLGAGPDGAGPVGAALPAVGLSASAVCGWAVFGCRDGPASTAVCDTIFLLLLAAVPRTRVRPRGAVLRRVRGGSAAHDAFGGVLVR
jgi:hypothetical protein